MNPSEFLTRVKIFLDGADEATMVEMSSHPRVAGFTTNPSLIKKAGIKNYEKFCRGILPKLSGKPVSFEVFADDFREMKRQALKIKSWESKQDQIYVKIPILNSVGVSSIPLIRELTLEGVKLNVTAIYTLKQVLETCLVSEKTAGTLVSVFAGRIADSGRDPLPLMQAAVEACESAGKKVELLWASTREAFNLVQADQIGCHIITAPADLIKKTSGFGKAPFQLSLETVQQFKIDAETAGFAL